MASVSEEMLEAIFKEILGKLSLQPRRRGRGRPGASMDCMVKAFVLMLLRGLSGERGLERYLRDHPREASLCGFASVPWHSTFSRFRRRMGEAFFKELFKKAGEVLEKELPCGVAVLDSTPIPKPKDPEAEKGFYSRGAFKGFKVHAASCEHGLPRSVEVTAGNRHDSPLMPRLLRDVGCLEAVVADSGCDSEENHRHIVEGHEALPIIARNRRSEKDGRFKKEAPSETTLPYALTQRPGGGSTGRRAPSSNSSPS